MNNLRLCNISRIKNISRDSSNFLHKLFGVQFSTAVKKDVLNENTIGIPSISTEPSISEEFDPEEAKIISKDILSKINAQIKEKSHSRLFAVIKLCEHQFKITAEDIITVGSFFPANVGDKICLEKVLAVGSTDFTLFGRPLLSKDLVRIEATIIEKTYIVPRPLFRHYKQYRRLHWFRTPYVLMRINSIEFKNTLDELPDVEGLDNRVIY